MRRFERSGKFWEISVEGREVVTRSGKIGADGRSSRKKSRNAALVKTDHDKKIEKRLAEGGWVEVRAPLQVDFHFELQIGDLDADLVERLSRRPGTMKPDGMAAALAIRATMKRELPLWKAGKEQLEASADEEVQRAVSRIMGKGPERIRGTAVEIAALLVMAPQAEAADLLVARFGLEKVVTTVAKGPRLRLHRSLRERWLAPGEAEKVDTKRNLARVGTLLLQAPEAVYEICSSVAERSISKTTAPERVLDLATMFPGAPWVDAVASGLGRGDERIIPFASLVGPRGFQKLIDLCTRSNRLPRLVTPANTLLHRFGVDGAPAARRLGDHLEADGMPLLLRLPSQETAELFVGRMSDKKTVALARDALLKMPGWSLIALCSANQKGAKLDLAVELAEHPDVVAAIVGHLDKNQLRRVRKWAGKPVAAEIEDSDVPGVLDNPGDVPLPNWLKLPRLPPLFVPDGSGAYPASARQRAAEILSEAPSNPALLDAVDPASLSAFACGILDQWNDSQANEIYEKSPWTQVITDEEYGEPRWRRDPKAPEELFCPWPVQAVAAVGDGDGVHALGRYIEQWSRRSGRYPELVREALPRLCAMPHQEVLVVLGRMKGKSKTTRVDIEVHLKKIARERGLRPDEIDEVLLPVFSLDARSQCVLDYGPRQFIGGFDAHLDPVILDTDGKPRKSLPRVAKTDDSVKANETRANWTTLKKNVRSVRTGVFRRLEGALRSQRRIRPSHFLRNLAAHPLARPAVSALIWRSGTAFRVDESGQPVDCEEEPVVLEDWVTLVHPVHLTKAEKDAWSEVLGDYELLQPFPQLSREVYGPASEGAKPDVADTAIPPAGLFALRHWGWDWVFSGDGEYRFMSGLELRIGGWHFTVQGTGVDPKAPDGFVLRNLALFKGSWGDVPAHLWSEVRRDLQRAARAGQSD